MQNYERITPDDYLEAVNFPENGDTTKAIMYAFRLWQLENEIKAGNYVKFDCPKIGDTVYCVLKGALNMETRTRIRYVAECEVYDVQYSVAQKKYYLYVRRKADAYDTRCTVYNDTAFITEEQAKRRLAEVGTEYKEPKRTFF